MGRRRLAAVLALARCLPSTRTARVLRTCIASMAAAREGSRMPDCFYPATLFMGRQRVVAAARAMGPCLPSAPMGRVSRPYIFLQAAVTEVIRLPVCFYQTAPCMERLRGAIRAMAPCSRSTPMARALRTCIVSRLAAPILPLSVYILTATELIHLAD